MTTQKEQDKKKFSKFYSEWANIKESEIDWSKGYPMIGSFYPFEMWNAFLAGLRLGRTEYQELTDKTMRETFNEQKFLWDEEWQEKVAELRKSVKSYDTPYMKSALEDCKNMFLWDIDRIFFPGKAKSGEKDE